MREPPSLLLVSDQPDAIAPHLGGCDVAPTGADALRMACGHHRLILLDSGLPYRSAAAFAQALSESEQTSDIPILAVLRDPEHAAALLDAGATDTLCMPLQPDIVRARVEVNLRVGELHARLRYEQGLDHVSRVPGRGYFDRMLQLEWRRARREHPLAVVMIDLDHFQQFNEAYGHQAGDEALRSVATALTEAAFRPADLLARHRGKTFAALLPDTDLEGGRVVAERLRAAVTGLEITHRWSTVAGVLSASVGLACLVPTPETSPDDLVEAADQAAYRAKREGRDRVVVAGS